MSGDKFARILTGLAVLAVAVVAGYVSYGHIEFLGLSHGYGIDAARVLPVSVDGLIVASSMALLTGSAPWLARVGLVLGILATLAANIAAGAEFGIVGALVNAWPAVAFIVASEILLKMIRPGTDAPRGVPAIETVAAVPTPSATVHEAVADAVPVDVPGSEPTSTVSPVPVGRVRAVASGRAPKRAQPGRPKPAERVFAAEIEAGELPSLRSIKTRMQCGTDRARVIRAELASTMEEATARAA